MIYIDRKTLLLTLIFLKSKDWRQIKTNKTNILNEKNTKRTEIFRTNFQIELNQTSMKGFCGNYKKD